MKPIAEQVILITGATDGLGKMVAHHLAREGAKLLLHGRSFEKGKSVLEEIKKSSGNSNVSYYNADFSSLEEVRNLAKSIIEEQD